MAVAGTFFQKKESHRITYTSGRHKTELDLMVVRQQHLRRVKDSKVGEKRDAWKMIDGIRGTGEQPPTGTEEYGGRTVPMVAKI